MGGIGGDMANNLDLGKGEEVGFKRRLGAYGNHNGGGGKASQKTWVVLRVKTRGNKRGTA